MRFDTKTITYCTLICLLIFWGVLLRLTGFDKSIWLDEYSSIQVAILAPDLWDSLRNYDHPPLYYAFLKLWSFFGEGETFLRIPSLIFGVSTTLVLIRWLHPKSRVAALTATLLSSLSPIFIRYSQEIRGYSLLLLATALAFYYADRLAATHRESDLLKLSLALCLAVGSHLVGFMVIGSVFVYLVCIDWRRTGRISWKIPVSSTVLPALIGIIFYLGFMRGAVKTEWWMPDISTDHIWNTSKYLFGIDSITSLKSALPISHATYALTLYILALVPVSTGLLIGRISQNWPLLMAAFAFFGLVTLYSLVSTSIFWYRTLLPGLIPLIAFASLQIGHIRFRPLQVSSFACLGLLAGCAALGWVSSEGIRSREAWKESSAMLRKRYQDHDLIIYCPSYAKGPINYYFNDVPEAAQITMDFGPNHRQKISLLTQKIQSASNRTSSNQVFMVVRNDMTLQKNTEIFQHLQALLSHYSATPPHLSAVGNLNVWCYQLGKNHDNRPVALLNPNPEP